MQRKIARHKTQTDKGGRYAFIRVKAGEGYTIRATAAGARSTATAPFALAEGDGKRQDIELERNDVSTQTTATSATTSSTTDTRTNMTTTATVLTGTTTGSTTTGTTTGSTTTGTTSTSTSSSTTTLPPSSTSSGPPVGKTSFDDLIALVTGTAFDPNPAVNIEEARQFRRLYTVANYTLARVHGAIGALNTLLNTSTPPGSAGPVSTLPLISKQQLIDRHQATIDSILARASDNTRTERDLLEAARAQFDLGTTAVTNVNLAFKGLFRDFVGLCANDLLAVDLQVVTPLDLSEQQKKEELVNFLKRTKRAMLRLVENMSFAGTLGSNSLIDKWSRVHKDSIEVLSDVHGFVGSDDADRKHIWSIVAELNGTAKSTIDGYIVHAREGGALLSDAVDAYQQLSTKGELTKEDQGHLRDLFFDSAKYSIQTENISARLRRNALLIQENWTWA